MMLKETSFLFLLKSNNSLCISCPSHLQKNSHIEKSNNSHLIWAAWTEAPEWKKAIPTLWLPSWVTVSSKVTKWKPQNGKTKHFKTEQSTSYKASAYFKAAWSRGWQPSLWQGLETRPSSRSILKLYRITSCDSIKLTPTFLKPYLESTLVSSFYQRHWSQSFYQGTLWEKGISFHLCQARPRTYEKGLFLQTSLRYTIKPHFCTYLLHIYKY